jgi:trans-aconitate 2-methyltransferase
MPPRDWNATSYDEVSAPQQAWGAEVVARLELRGDETVLDAGCGTGRVTEMVLERLPHGHVLAVDGSPSMAAKA